MTTLPHKVTDTQRPARKYSIAAWLGIFALAFVVRYVYLHQIEGLIYFKHLVGDAKGYDAWARRLIANDWQSTESFYQAPLYPYFLACVYKAIGGDLGWLRVVQAILGSAGCVATGLAGALFISRSAGMIAGVLMAVYPPAIYCDGVVQKETLALALTAALLLVIGEALRRDVWRKWLATGVLIGLLSLTRENALSLAPIVILWTMLRAGATLGRRIMAAAAISVGCIVTLLPVAWHNVRTAGTVSLTTFQTGPNFYMGNHEGADGRYSPLIPGRETFEFERVDAIAAAEHALGQSLSPREVSDYWLHQAYDYIRNNPAAWLRLMWTKWQLTWNRYEIPDTESYYIYRGASPLLSLLGRVWHFGVLCPVAVAGVVLTIRRRRELAVLYAMPLVFAASVAAFYVFARYRVPLVPMLAIFAGGAVTEAVDAVAARRWKTICMASAVAVIAAWWVNQPINPESKLDAAQLGNLGAALAEAGRLEEALPVFERAVAMYPDAPRLRQFLGDALSLGGLHEPAIEQYEAALAIEPDRPNTEFNLAVALEHVGRAEEALSHYRRAAKANPKDAEARGAIRRLTR